MDFAIPLWLIVTLISVLGTGVYSCVGGVVHAIVLKHGEKEWMFFDEAPAAVVAGILWPLAIFFVLAGATSKGIRERKEGGLA